MSKAVAAAGRTPPELRPSSAPVLGRLIMLKKKSAATSSSNAAPVKAAINLTRRAQIRRERAQPEAQWPSS